MVRIRVEPELDADAIIVGAGPAGSAMACHLGRTGLKVILIDRQSFPRDKVCGDFVGPAALVELRDLGVTDRSDYRKSNVTRSAALFLDGRPLIFHSIPRVKDLPAYGRVIPRMLLDGWLVEAARGAGVELLEGWQAAAYTTEGDCIRLELRAPGRVCCLRSRLLVGADGSSSLVARQMRGHSTPRRDRIVAVRAYYENVQGPQDQADLYFTAQCFPGYYWLFPTGNGSANVGAGIALETTPPGGDSLRELLLQLVTRDRALARRLDGARLIGKISGWPLATFNPHLPLIDDHLMLIGDAAGLINPLNGEGIQYALLSAKWAAETAVSCARQGSFSHQALRTYAERVERELRYDMALARLIVQCICNRNLNPLWLEALRIIAARARLDPDYAHVAGGILAGLVPARDALSLGIVSGTIEQAAMSFGLSAALNLAAGPTQWARLGLDTAGVGFRILHDSVRNPGELLGWFASLTADAVELAGEASKDLLSVSLAPS